MKKRRYLLITLGAVFLLLVASLGFLHTDPGRRFLIGHLQAYLEDNHELSFQLEDADYNLLMLSATVHGLSLRAASQTEPAAFLTADYVEIDLSLLDLIRGGVTIENARVEGISFTVVADREGRFNLPPWFISSNAEVEQSPTDILILSLVVTEGAFSFFDESRGLDVDVPRWTLEISGQRSDRAHKISLSTLDSSEIRVLEKVLILDRFDASSSWSSAGIRLEALNIEWDQSELKAVGDVPLSSDAELDAEVSISIDSAQLSTLLGLTEPVSGFVEAKIRFGDSLDAPSLEARLSGEALTWRSLKNVDLKAELEWRIQDARVQVRDAIVSTPQGTLRGTSQLALTETAGDSETEAQVSGLNLEWLSTFLDSKYRVSSFGSGEFDLSWPALDLTQTTGTGAFTLSPLRGGIRPGRMPVAGRVSFDATHEEVLVSTDTLRAGGFHLTGEMSVRGTENLDLFTSPIIGQISGTIEDLGTASANFSDFLETEIYLASLGGSVQFEAAINGTLNDPQSSFTVRAYGVESYPMTGIDLQINGDFSRKKLRVSEAVAYWRSGSLHLKGSLGYPGDQEPRLDLTGTLRGLPLGDLAEALEFPYPSGGEVSADIHVTGAVLQPRVDLEIRIPDWHLAGEQLGFLSIAGHFEDEILELSTITVQESESEGGEILKASGRFDFANGTISAEAAGQDLDITSFRIAEGWDLAGPLDLSARARGTWDNPELSLDLELRTPSLFDYGFAPVEMKASLENAQFVANVVASESGLSALVSGKTIRPFPLRVSVRAEDTDLSRLPFVAQIVPGLTGHLTGEALADGDLSDWQLGNLSATVTDLHIDWSQFEVSLSEPFTAVYRDKALLVERSTLELGSGSMEIGGGLPLEADGSDSRLVIKLNPEMSDLLKLVSSQWQVEGFGNLDLRIEAAGSLMEPELSGRLTISDAGLTGPIFPVPISDLEVLASFQGSSIQLDRLSALAGGGTLSADGVLLDFSPEAGDETLRVSLALEEFPLESLGVLPQSMRGLATAQLELTSQAASLDALAGVVAFGELQLTVGELALHQREPVLLSLQNGEIWLERFELIGPDSQVTGSGGIDFLEPGALDLKLEGSVSTTSLAELVENIEASGKSQFQLVVGGLPGPPQFSGQFDVADGTLLIPSQGLQFDDVVLQVRASENRFQIETLTGDLNGASFKGDGTVEYLEGEKRVNADVSTVLTDIHLDWPRGLRTISDGVIAFRSAGDRFLLQGELRIREGAYRERFDLGGSAVRLLSTGRRAEVTLEPNPFLSLLDFDIDVETIDPIIVDNNLAELILQGRVQLKGDFYRPGLIGVINLEPGGEIYLRERTYVVEYGAISFQEENRIRPNLNVRARTRVQGYDVTLQAMGPLGDLNTSFSSDPALAEPDVVSMLLTGRTLEELRGAEASVAQEQALSMLAGAAGGKLGRGVENAIGLTRVRIEPYLIAPESNPETRLTVGQDITSDLTGIYSVNLADTGDQIWVAEYDVTRRFRTRGIKQADNTYRMDLNHRLRFPRGSGSRRSAQDRRIVGTIQFEGDHSFPESKLSEKFKLRPGQRYDFFEAQEGLNKVRGLFDDQDLLEARVRLQSYESEGVIDLLVRIESGPVVTLQFTGDEVSSSTQDRVRQLWSQGVSDSQRRRESVREIRRRLFAEGFLTGQVDCRISIADGIKRVTFEVTNGPEFRQTTLYFEGSEAFESEWLQTQLEEADLLLALYLDPGEATDFVQRLYRRRGFLNARVEAPVIHFDEAASEARVTLSIEEGPVYRVGAIAFSGNRVFGDEALQEAAGVTTEDIYYPGILGEMVVRLEDFYWSKGYNRSEINETAQRVQDYRIDLSFQIEENIQDIVEEIEISGNDRVSAGFIERQMSIEIGEVLDLEIISRARKRLYDIGAFSLVEIEPVEIERTQDTKGTQRPMRLAVRVRETVPHRLNYGAFFDTDRGPGVTVDYRNHNLLRNGRVLGLSGRFDGDRQETRGYFSQPAHHRFPLRTHVSGFVAREFRPSFEFDEVGMTIEQQAEIRDTLIGSYGFSYIRNTIRKRDPDVMLEDVPLNVGALNTALAWDTRDSFMEPTGGHFLTNSFRFAPTQLGSDLPFIKYFGGYSRYFPLTEPSRLPFGGDSQQSRLIFATWVRVGLAKGFDQDTISPTERFFAGGGTTIRGFKQDTVGPVDANGVPIGGNSLFIWNNEIRFPIFSILDGVGFLDVGNVYPTVSDFNPLEVREAAGFGVRIRTPFILVRFDYGFKLDRKPGESRGAFFFSIGQAF